MSSLLVRTEAHALRTSPAQRADVERTIAFYRHVVRLLCTVVLTHWPELGPLRSKERLTALERMFHRTTRNPGPRYARLDAVLGKMPSYLRRAAINAACGAASSFLSNYDNWLDDAERKRGNRPPRLGLSKVFPPLYGGNMLLDGNQSAVQQKATLATPTGHVRVKLLGADGHWRFSEPLKLHGRMKRLRGAFELSPSLVQQGTKTRLSCPVEVRRPKFILDKHVHRVLSVDVGINTAATLAVVDSSGTVISRRFLTCGKHNDQRDDLGRRIAARQVQSNGGSGRRLGEGFCRTLHRRVSGISLQAARELASQIAAFAREHQVQAVVIEALKGFRPKGGSRRQRPRFHRFQHRMLVQYLGYAVEEAELRLIEVYARGTSRWAYDGSGKVRRSKDNAQNCTFNSGKQYNADLNGAYNIAARGLALLLNIKNPKGKPAASAGAETGESSGSAERMPLVLADIWAHSAQMKAAAH